MANEEQLQLLLQGVSLWNQWRISSPGISISLSKADLRGADLHEADLREANLSKAKLRGADLREADLSKTDLSKAYLYEAKLHGADLRKAKLRGADLRGVNLSGADLSKANLNGANLNGANLSGVNLNGANLSGARLRKTQVLGTNFERATFTGACLEDWNTNSATKFDGAICDYVYLKANQQECRPREGKFKPGEFAALFQQAVNTVDLIFKDGIDWQAFFQSFQDLRTQYADQDLSIQAIEKKKDGAFVVRIEVAEGADKSAIEGSAKELYETKLTLLEQRYRAELQAKDGEIVAYREQSANLMKITELLGSKIMPSEINQTFNAPVANAAGTNHGTMSAIQHNYGPNTEDITRLLTTLRDQAQTFPIDQKDDAIDILDDLESDLTKPQSDPARIGRRLKKLVAIAATLTISTAAFTADLAQLAQVLNISIPQIQAE